MSKTILIYFTLFLLLCVSLVSIVKIETTGRYLPILEQSIYREIQHKINLLFPESTYLRIYVERFKDESAFDYYRRLEEFSSQIEKLPQVQKTLSVTKIQQISVENSNFQNEIIYKGEAQSAVLLDENLKRDTVFASFFLSSRKPGTYLYLFYPQDEWSTDFYKSLQAIAAFYPDRQILLFGNSVFEELVVKLALQDLAILGIIAISIILIVESFYFRSIRFGILFTSITIIPAVYVMALLAPLQIQFTPFLIPVPILSLVLSTTYTLHIVYYTTNRPEESLETSLRTVFPIVITAGISTAIGFLTMTFASVEEMRSLGVLMAAGVVFSLAVAWLALPPLIPLYRKQVPQKTKQLQLPILGKSTQILLVIVAIAGSLGIFLYESEHFVLRRSTRDTALQSYMQAHRSITGATDEFTIVLDSHKEYGFVSLHYYNKLLNLERELKELSYCSDVISITKFIGWMNGRIEGKHTVIKPKNEIQIGESLELLYSVDTGISPASLISPDYSAIKVRILIDAGESTQWKSNLGITETKREIGAVFNRHFPEMTPTISSNALHETETYHTVLKGIILSLTLYFPAVFLFLFVQFRSLPAAAIAVLPSLLSALFFLGLMGYLGFYFSIAASVSICMLIGVCVDDAVVLIQFYLTHNSRCDDKNQAIQYTLHEVGTVIIRTTVIIVVSVSVLLFSSYLFMVQAGALMIAAFVLSTLLTLYVVPKMLLIIKHKKRLKV